ncbi:MAG: hypothetical protein EBZ50_10990 [Alphaproteobacteria bacterium]|nr:hypothetical protein [Alphaproteobacteria bacterium]
MNPVGASSVVFVTLSGLFWGGWLVGSQTPQGQEALAKAYASYTAEELAGETQDLFAPNALRALVCGVGAGPEDREARPCLAVAAAGRLFVVDAGSGAAMALDRRAVQLGRLEAVLLTGADPVRAADLDEMWVRAAGPRNDRPLPVYGPADSYAVVEGLNMALAAQGMPGGLQPWAPAPEPGQSVIVFEADGLRISAFTTEKDAFAGRVGYRFDYRGRSLVVAGDGRAEWAEAAADADVVMHGAQSQMLAQLHKDGAATPFEVATAAKTAGAGMLVLTGVDPNPMIAEFQVREAKQAGLADVVAGRMGLLLELPLTSREVNVRPL